MVPGASVIYFRHIQPLNARNLIAVSHSAKELIKVRAHKAGYVRAYSTDHPPSNFEVRYGLALY